MKKIPPYILGLFIVFISLVHCSSSNSFVYSGIDQNFTVALSGGDPEATSDSIDTTGDDVVTDEEYEGEEPDAPPTVSDGDVDDDDGDGIENDDDEIPDVCTAMVVSTVGVSSATVILNGEEIFTPDDFKNEDITLTENVNLQEGSNTMSVRLTGSAGDQLNVRIYNCSKDPSELIFESTVTRTAGSPDTDSGSF